MATEIHAELTKVSSASQTEAVNEGQSNSTSKASASKASRPYHSWQGNNTICCNGRVIGGPQKNNFFYTLALILVPSVLFTVFVCRHYIEEHSYYYVLVVYLLLFITTIVSLTLTAFSDPGIIPRGILPSNIEYKGPVHLKQRMCISGQLIEIKWCSTCHVFRPPRSFHCYICNNCVERFDHHCPWIGNCIGVRNYLHFSIFINSLQLLCFWALFHCIYILYLRGHADPVRDDTSWQQFVHAMKHEYMAFVTALYVFIGMWFVIGLTFFHCFLVFVGKTTNEQLRNLHPAGSPFKRSCIGNMVDMCCKLPRSSVHLHHVSPTASYNELYINKSRVILLDQKEVEKHHQQTHSKHISENSPFKACLINNFGYHPYSNHNRQNLNGLTKSLQYTQKMLDSNSNQNGKSHSNHRNGIKNGYSAHIQMTDQHKKPMARHHSNGNDHAHKHEEHGRSTGYANVQIDANSDGKIEEEEQHESSKQPSSPQAQSQPTSHSHHIIQIQQAEATSDHEQEQEDDEEEENKYNERREDDRESSKSSSISRSRKDENEDAENLYISYDDDDDEEERRDANNLNVDQHAGFQYSRTPTPEVSALQDEQSQPNLHDDASHEHSGPNLHNHASSTSSEREPHSSGLAVVAATKQQQHKQHMPVASESLASDR